MKNIRVFFIWNFSVLGIEIYYIFEYACFCNDKRLQIYFFWLKRLAENEFLEDVENTADSFLIVLVFRKLKCKKPPVPACNFGLS